MTRQILTAATLILLSGLVRCSNKTPNVPLLVLANAADFGAYTGEILKTEGFNEFTLDSLTSGRVTASYLKKFDIVILAEAQIDLPVQRMLLKFVKNGGNLIAFSPDPALAELFGIVPAGGNITEGYIRIDTTTAQGKGLTGEALRFHGKADKNTVNTAEIIAKLHDDPSAGSAFPAVVSNIYGKGRSAAFLYNLPKSIVTMRQGNPQLAGKETDGINGIRAMDMFTDGWVSSSGNILNPADEQMRLLSHCIEAMGTFSKPLPRFWYFPDTLQCLVTLTNDGEYRNEADFEDQFCDMDFLGAKMSLYVLETDKVSKTWVDKWTAQGFEISGHPDDTREAADPQWQNMDDALISKKKEIAEKYGLTMRTVVNHWFVWCGKDSAGNPDFAAQAKLEAKNGLQLDANYAHYDNNSSQGHFLGPLGINQGNFTGSGLLMKFADQNGRILDIYQLLTNVYDQQYMENHDPEGYLNCFKGLLDRSLEEQIFSFISVKAHNDEYWFSRKTLLKMLDYAHSKQVPMWTAARLLDFMQMKDQAGFSDFHWSNGHLSFKLTSSLKNADRLAFLLPARHGRMKIMDISLNGQSTQINRRHIKGYEYALISIIPGSDYHICADYR